MNKKSARKAIRDMQAKHNAAIKRKQRGKPRAVELEDWMTPEYQRIHDARVMKQREERTSRSLTEDR